MVCDAREDLILVDCAFVEAWHENFPDTGPAAASHRIYATIPPVEVTHNTDALRIGRPNGKMRATYTAHFAEMRAELLILLVVRALGRQMQVVVRQQRRECVCIEEFHSGSGLGAPANPIRRGRWAAPW